MRAHHRALVAGWRWRWRVLPPVEDLAKLVTFKWRNPEVPEYPLMYPVASRITP